MKPGRDEPERGAAGRAAADTTAPAGGHGAGGATGRLRRGAVLLLTVVVAVVVASWLVGRITADGRRLVVRQAADVAAPVEPGSERIRIVAWNIAHGRGDIGPGWSQNWLGGSAEDRITRFARIADLLRRVDADVVVLNEVDFDVGWSGGVNQAEVLARVGGYGVRVEQRNYDVRLLFARFAFGNAVLSRLPVREARFVELPPFSRLESRAVGAKAASVVRLETVRGPIAVVPVHLEARSRRARLAAVDVFADLRSRERAPVVLAGDFNTAPADWPGTDETTAVTELLELGWTSPRPRASPGPEQWTFPTYDLDRALDWILVEPPLRVVEARPIRGIGELSDHVPVLAVVEVPDPAATGDDVSAPDPGAARSHLRPPGS